MKSLAIGRDDFKHIIENDSYYIDKTKFIEEFNCLNNILIYIKINF